MSREVIFPDNESADLFIEFVYRFKAYQRNQSLKILTDMAKNQYHTGGIAPLGYYVDPVTRRLAINPVEASLVRFIFTSTINDNSFAMTSQWLNEMGAKTKRGRKFTPSSVRSVLFNEKYIGIITYNKKYGKNGRLIHKSAVKPENEWIVTHDESYRTTKWI